MRLYTRTGDDGSTGLFGGGRVGKDSLRIAATGDVDELNSHVGLALTACSFDELSEILVTLQHRLFELGADLATPLPEPGQADKAATPRIGEAQVAEAERQIDAVCAPLEPMKHFVLPGGTELAALLHVARAVCRRAERTCIALSRHERVGLPVLQYLNRVSDLLFAMTRRANQLAKVADVPWVGGNF